jgi:hypothetical protein
MTARSPIIIPPALKPLTAKKRWVVWKWMEIKGADGETRWTKPPFRANAPSKHASSTDPSTWCDTNTAMVAYMDGKCDGIGFVLTDSNINAVDIDDCRNATTGEMHPWAADKIARAGSYVEVTPSNEGVRIIGLSNGGDPLHCACDDVPGTNGVRCELYRKAERYITITGNQIGEAKGLADIDALLDALDAELPSSGAERGARRPRARKHDTRFGALNERALKVENLPKWVKAIFPTAKRTRAGGYRVKSVDLGRGFQEDLSISPKGIKYFGVADQGDKRKGRRTPIELVAEWQHVEPPQAADWLEKALSAAEQEAPPAPEPPEKEAEATDADVEITRLAALSALDYEQQRKGAAEKLDVRASILDKLVQAERERLGLSGGGDDGKQGHAVSFPEPEPWREPVGGEFLLDGIASAIRAHVVMPDYCRDLCALWVLHSYLIDRFLISPRLGIRSPTKGCGKTLLLDVLGCLVARPLPTTNVTPAAIFRVIEAHRPTLLIDEADTFLYDNDELRGVLNGNRKGSTVLRTVGDDHEPRAFSVYSACAIALIGALPDTLHDRSVTVDLKRRLPSEKTEPLVPTAPTISTCSPARRHAGRKITPTMLGRQTRKCRPASSIAPPTICAPCWR